jgi:hypothetical protein
MKSGFDYSAIRFWAHSDDNLRQLKRMVSPKGGRYQAVASGHGAAEADSRFAWRRSLIALERSWSIEQQPGTCTTRIGTKCSEGPGDESLSLKVSG